MPGRTRLLYLDIFRGLAIIAVLVIHTTSSPVASLPKHSLLYPYYFIVNSVCQFAVPAFLFLSALVLFYNYYGAGRINWKDFYLKRLRTIVVPYVILSFLYFAADSLIDGVSIWGRWPVFLKGLLFGGNYFHLYFVVILLQFFVLFPFMLAAARLMRSRAAMAALGMGLQVVFYLANYYVFDMTRVGSCVGTYLVYLFLGACAGIALQNGTEANRRRGLLLYPALALLAAGFVAQLWMQRAYPHWIGQPWLSMIHSASKYSYCAICCFALLGLSRHIRLKMKGWGRRFLPLLGETSFGIYLIHPFILLLWRREIMTNGPLAYHLLIWMGGLAALSLSWLLTCWLHNRRWGVYVVGGKNVRAAEAHESGTLPAKSSAGSYSLRKN